MNDDFSALTKQDHYLGWLGDDPAQIVRDEIKHMLQQQVATARLNWVQLRDDPYFLTGGRRMHDDPDKIIMTRAALAAAFELEVESAERVELLEGVFSWVAAGLDGERKDRTYLDLGAEMEWAAEMLKLRVYELDAPTET